MVYDFNLNISAKGRFCYLLPGNFNNVPYHVIISLWFKKNIPKPHILWNYNIKKSEFIFNGDVYNRYYLSQISAEWVFNIAVDVNFLIAGEIQKSKIQKL